MPEEIATLMRKDPAKIAAAAANAAAKPTVATPVSTTVPTVKRSTLIAEIPPFNPSKKLAASSVPSAAAATGTGTGTKINANAPAFVFRPTAGAFVPVRFIFRSLFFCWV